MNDFDNAAMLLLIVVPLAGSLSMMFMPGGQTKQTWYFAIFIAAVSLALSLAIFINYDYNQGGFQYTVSYEWLPGPLDINLSLGLDGISAPMILLNGIVLLGGVLVSQTINYRPREFFVLLFALAAGAGGSTHVPAYWCMGQQHGLRHFPAHQRIRGNEAADILGGR